MTARPPLHGVAVACRGPDGWRAVWITGAPGMGKSDLALRLITRGWRLVADDYAHVFASGGWAWAAAPEGIAGRIEARGIGIHPASVKPGATRIVLAVALTHGAVERLPEPETATLAGVVLPLIRLDAREGSAPEKVALGLAAL